MDGGVTGEMSFRFPHALSVQPAHQRVAEYRSAVILPRPSKALTVARNLEPRARGFTTAVDKHSHYRPAMNVQQRPTQDGAAVPTSSAIRDHGAC
jgi:hypothetical protein